jgi:S1-C subfamily serine protease
MSKHLNILLGSIAVSLAHWSAFSQIVSPENLTFVGAEMVAAETKPAVFAIQVAQVNPNISTNWLPLGSGFILDKSNRTFCVTCDHVVAAAERLCTKPGFQNDIFAGFDTQSNGYVRLPCKVACRDSSSDVAILLPQQPYHLTTNGMQRDFQLTNLRVPENLVAGAMSLVDGRGVLIVGYPLGLGVQANQNHPIVRFGMIAQSSASNPNTFLIDGMASHGNSGSPVFSLSPPHTYLIGMATGFMNESINLLDDDGQPAASSLLKYTKRLDYRSSSSRL